MKKRCWKKGMAVIVSVCCMLAAIPLAGTAKAESAKTPESYAEWEKEIPVNGSFEAGYEGMDVYGWKLVPFTYESNIEKDPKNEFYATTNHTAKTKVLEDGNKVAQLNRVGLGYAGLGSQPIEVTGGQVYQFSFDYRTVDVHTVSSGGDIFHGLNLAVQQFDEAGEEVAFDSFRVGEQGYGTGEYGYGRTVSDQWYTLTQSVGMRPDAATAVMYIVIRGQWNVRAEVWLDNACVKKCEKDEVWNGDFELDGLQQDRGVVGWKLVSCTNAGVPGENWIGHFNLSIEKENGNSYLKFAPVNTVTGYALAQSSLIPVSASQEYAVSFDFKEANLAETVPQFVPQIIVYYYGSDRVYQSAKTLKTLDYNLTDWTKIVCEGTAPEGAAYMTINFFIGGVRGQGNDINYFDNVKVSLNDHSQIFNGSGEYVLDDATAPGWSWVSTQRDGSVSQTNNWARHYTITALEDTDRDGSVFKIVHAKDYGYAELVSSKVNIEPGKRYDLSYWYKMTDFDLENPNGYGVFALNPVVVQYGADGQQVGSAIVLGPGSASKTEEVTEWTQFFKSFTANEKAVSCELQIKMGSDSGHAAYNIWLDDIRLTEKPAWKSETTTYEATGPRDDNANFTGNYDITLENIDGREDVLKLYVTRSQGVLGAVTYFSEKIPVTGDTSYENSYDLKITGVDVEKHSPGAVYVLRYLDADGGELSYERIFDSVTAPARNQDWTHYSNTIKTPASAAYVQVGLLIGDSTMGGSDENPIRLKDLVYYYDNIALEKVEVPKDINEVLFEGGDCDRKPGTDTCDLVHFMKLRAGAAKEEFNENADMNKNSRYDADDKTLLMWKLIEKR